MGAGLQRSPICILRVLRNRTEVVQGIWLDFASDMTYPASLPGRTVFRPGTWAQTP